MKPYFETHPIGIVWIVLAVATALIEFIGLLRSRSGARKSDRGSLIVLRLCMAPAIAFLVLSPRIASSAEIRPPLASLLIGTVIFATGEVLRIWSRATLGKYFTYTVQTSTEQPVIQTGPYRFVRHPSYTGIMLMVIGLGAAWANWLGLAVVTVLTMVAIRYRIHVEEAVLTSDLDGRYDAYSRTHKRLVPYIW